MTDPEPTMPSETHAASALFQRARKKSAAEKVLRFRLLILFLVAVLIILSGYVGISIYNGYSFSQNSQLAMPGKSHRGPLPKQSASQKKQQQRLESHVKKLATEIGERNLGRRPNQLYAAADYIEAQLKAFGYSAQRQAVGADRQKSENILCEIAGSKRPKEIVIVGAHYDSVQGCPGANDNGSGVAAVLAIAETLAKHKPDRTLRFVLFTNEEPPYFQTARMGSLHYARWCKSQGENVVAMISIETIGYYSDKPGSQHYPAQLAHHYPTTGNFIGFVGDMRSGDLVKQAVATFRARVQFPCEGAALPGNMPGVGWSDHWSFWQQGYKAIMVTDTAPFRYPHYHLRSDTPDKLNFERMSRVVEGLKEVVVDFVDGN